MNSNPYMTSIDELCESVCELCVCDLVKSHESVHKCACGKTWGHSSEELVYARPTRQQGAHMNVLR